MGTLDDPPQCDDEKEDYLEEIQKLAIDIFTDHAPGDKSPNNLDPCYFECLTWASGTPRVRKRAEPCSMDARSSARRAGTTRSRARSTARIAARSATRPTRTSTAPDPV